MVLEEGQVLDGKYVIVRVLATGSMGEVYLGRNERIGKEVAVKVMRRDLAEDRAIVNRFEQEARIATAVRSSHVVDVYDLGELPTGERFIVMEYVDGESLGTRMAREGKLSARALGAITLQILDGLVAAHAAGVIHRDLKPDNVILTMRDGQEIVKLVDFGVSKRSDSAAPRDLQRATLDGTLLGTPMFMSPEQARGDSNAVDHRTDIFSLGVSMYEALSGEVPFNADNVVSLLSRIMNEPEPPLERRVPKVDPGLARIVQKAMAKDPSDRYQTAAEMREAVAAWYAVFGSTSAMRSSLEGVAHLSTPPPVADEIVLPKLGIRVDRKRARAALGAAAFAAMFTALITRQSAPRPPPPTAAIAPAATPAPRDVLTVPTVPATSLAPPAVTQAPLPAAPAPIPTPKKSAIPSPEATPARFTRSMHPRPGVADAAAPAARDAGATIARDARDSRDAGVALAKSDDATAPAPETPLPDPPATP